jgi:hypothetical protein
MLVRCPLTRACTAARRARVLSARSTAGERTTSSNRRPARTYRSDATKNNLQRTDEAATVAAITDDE